MLASSPSRTPLPEGEAFHLNASPSQLPVNRSRSTAGTNGSRQRTISQSKSHSDMVAKAITPEEYDSLPPSIQRKYFASVERLRIAQQSAAQKQRKRHPSTEAWLAQKPSLDSMAARYTHSYKPSPLARHPPHPVRTDADVDVEQALRFLALPDKVKRSNFTPEELVLLTESSERALGTPSWMSEEDFHRRMTLDRMSSVCSSPLRSSFSEDPMEDPEKEWPIEVEAEQVYDQFAEKEIDPWRRDAQRRLGSMSSTHSSRLSTRVRSRPESGHRPFSRQRTMSLAPLPLPPPVLRPAIPPLPMCFSAANPPAGPPLPPMEEGIAPSTRYYKDSEARRKLREYLASPEKFDEALEFGFPSRSTKVERWRAETSTIAPALKPDTDEDSDLNSQDEEFGDHFTMSTPRTPTTDSEPVSPSIANHSSLDSGVALPYASIKPGPRSISPDICGREMTLRMTLTRSDLRAPERELYDFQRKQVSGVDVETTDPLALEAIQVCDDHTGAHGAFAISAKPSSGGFLKVFKNFRIRA